jgi:signal transduction histidine kinase
VIYVICGYLVLRKGTSNQVVFRVPTIGLLLIWALLFLPAGTRAQQTPVPKRVLVLYWYDKDFPGHVKWDDSFRSALKATSDRTIEYYPEYLEANRFPGAVQSEALHRYLKQKYSDRTIDVVVAQSEVSLYFLAKYSDDLFPNTPIVFYSGSAPRPEALESRSNMTGLVVFTEFRKTLDCALRLQPKTEHVFVISGSLEHDKRFERVAREEFRDYQGRLKFEYLTDLTPAELIVKTTRLPERSIVFYIWQQARDSQGTVTESGDIAASIARTADAPIFAMSGPLVGRGIVGGYGYTTEAGAIRAAEMVRQIAAGQPASSIPIEGVATMPMFDWRELRRWNIDENALPVGSLVLFRELTFWEHYKWRIVIIAILFLLQTSFIAVLLVERRRRKRAKESLDQLNAELETRIEARTAALNAKTRELETFAYSVAHDLKAPLRGIDGYSSLLLEDYGGSLDKEGLAFLKTIQSSADEMNSLIDDLLEYSRLERRELKTGRIELAPLVNLIVAEKKREPSARPVDFVINLNGETVIADSNGLTQSLRNYLDNAVKFTGRTAEPRVEIGAQANGDKCLLWVRDNGVGFDMKYHDRIFDIFQRLGATDDYPGTGIGLAIVRKAMERMGGRAWAHSKPGEGSTFYLEIPK